MHNLIDNTPRSIGPKLKVNPIGYGCWRLVNMPADKAQAILEDALATGINLVDTADVYGLDWGGTAFGEAESLLGKVLQQAPELRAKFVLASKGGIIPGVPYNSRDLVQACEASLKRLGLEQLDLYQIHRPDMLTHPAEVAAVLDQLRRDGKIKEVGVSNHTPSQTAALQAHLDFPIATQQPEYSALQLQPLFDGTFDQCMTMDQQVICWSPLAGGRLATGGQVAASLLATLDALAERESVDRATLALAFTLAHPSRPISLVGSINSKHIGNSSQALKIKLDARDVYSIIEASLGESLP